MRQAFEEVCKPVSYTVCARVVRRELGYGCGRNGADTRRAHSKFAPVMTLTTKEDDEKVFTYAIFHPTQRKLLACTSTGDIRIFNLSTGAEEKVYQVHRSYICHMQFGDQEYVEFSKVSDDRIIGTKGETATIFDTRSGDDLMTLTPRLNNQYTKNRATFNPTDKMVLSDGVLWDVNTGKEIHKFDKLNQTYSGVFHPNGFEVITNTEVWDLKTFRLLRTVPTLDKCEVIFNPSCTALYAICSDRDPELLEASPSRYTSFKTLDPYDYSTIATIEVNRNIYSLCVSRWGTQIAVAENTGDFDYVPESCVSIYDVGRSRDQDALQQDS